MSKEPADVKTLKELTPEEQRMKEDWVKEGVEIEFSKKPLEPNMKYYDYLRCR